MSSGIKSYQFEEDIEEERHVYELNKTPVIFYIATQDEQEYIDELNDDCEKQLYIKANSNDINALSCSPKLAEILEPQSVQDALRNQAWMGRTNGSKMTLSFNKDCISPSVALQEKFSLDSQSLRANMNQGDQTMPDTNQSSSQNAFCKDWKASFSSIYQQELSVIHEGSENNHEYSRGIIRQGTHLGNGDGKKEHQIMRVQDYLDNLMCKKSEPFDSVPSLYEDHFNLRGLTQSKKRNTIQVDGDFFLKDFQNPSKDNLIHIDNSPSNQSDLCNQESNNGLDIWLCRKWVGKQCKENEMEQLRKMTDRLQLNTKRESTIEWKEKYMTTEIKPYLWRHRIAHEVVNNSIKHDWSVERKGHITEAVAWLRQELRAMGEHDKQLARELITLRHNIQEWKLQLSTAENIEAIEDAVEQEEEKKLEEMTEICDDPPDQFNPRLKQMGLTRMNISRRRFSVF